jgi:hypothetical protein
MEAVNQRGVNEFLARIGIAVSDPQLKVGRELTFRTSPARTLVIHFGPVVGQDHMTRVISVVLSSQDSWVLIPRYGPASKISLSAAFPEADAFMFNPADRDRLRDYLCMRNMNIGSVSTDLYVVSSNGKAMITWAHHAEDEGVRIDLCDVTASSTLLSELNDVGVEMEISIPTTNHPLLESFASRSRS